MADEAAIIVEIDGLGTAGEGVGRLEDGRVVFVEGALPGDRVRVRLTRQRKGVVHAVIEEIVDPSVERVRPVCHAERCGGCALASLSTSGQQRAKRDRLLQTLRRIAKLDVDDRLAPVRQFGDGWRYRHRVRLHAAWEHGRWRLGYHGRRSHTLVPLGACPVLWPELERDAGLLSRAIKGISRQAEFTEVEIAHSRRDGRTAARITMNGPRRLLRHDLAWFDRSGLSGVEVLGPEGSWRHGNLELRYDHSRADRFDLKFEPSTFTQARPDANDELVKAVLTAVRPRHGIRVLELHAGIGNFSVPIAVGGAEVIAVESNPRSALLGRRNARRVGMHMRVVEATDEAALAGDELGPLTGFDCVLMDPPRTGARDAVVALAANGPGRVVYVSCDPATLARDARILVDGGYELSRVEAFDLFPQTPHVEVLAVFRRSQGETASVVDAVEP